jgi:hypothetical protein
MLLLQQHKQSLLQLRQQEGNAAVLATTLPTDVTKPIARAVIPVGIPVVTIPIVATAPTPEQQAAAHAVATLTESFIYSLKFKIYRKSETDAQKS